MSCMYGVESSCDECRMCSHVGKEGDRKIVNNRYLFRAKRIDNGEWVVGVPIQTHIGLFVCFEENPHYCSQYGYMEIDGIVKVDENTLCQCTGLTDKNGKLIFENDILSRGNLVVVWREKLSSYCLTKKGWMYQHFFGEAVDACECEVIGNIFDNPELLEA